MNNKIEELKNIKYFDGIEYKFEDYKDVLIELAKYSPENIQKMYKPFTKKGKYRRQTVDKIVALAKGELFDIDENGKIIEEKWEKIDFLPNYFVSKFGRIKTCDDKIISIYEKNESDGYLVFYDKNSEKEYLVYEAIAKTFNKVEELEKINYKGYEAHHINNNGHENTPENLIWLTEDQHKIVHGFKK